MKKSRTAAGARRAAANRPATRTSGRAAPRAASAARSRPARAKASAEATDGAPTASPPVRLARVAKGKKPQYFSDPAIDKLLWMTLTLMEELSVTRDRLDAVENLLEERRVLKGSEVDAYRPAPEAAQRRNRRRAEYVDRVLRAAQAELEELTGRDMPKSDAEVAAAVEA